MNKRRVKRYTAGFRRMAVERMRHSDNIVALTQELGVARSLLYRWRDQEQSRALKPGGPPEDARQTALQRENEQLKRVLADKTLEVDFFKGALQKIAARRQNNSASGETASTTRCGE